MLCLEAIRPLLTLSECWAQCWTYGVLGSQGDSNDWLVKKTRYNKNVLCDSREKCSGLYSLWSHGRMMNHSAWSVFFVPPFQMCQELLWKWLRVHSPLVFRSENQTYVVAVRGQNAAPSPRQKFKKRPEKKSGLRCSSIPPLFLVTFKSKLCH